MKAMLVLDEMPTKCEECPLRRYSNLMLVCTPLNKEADHENCPLKPRTGKYIYTKQQRIDFGLDDEPIYSTDYWCKCSVCGGDYGYRRMYDKFCKYCGAEMENADS